MPPAYSNFGRVTTFHSNSRDNSRQNVMLQSRNERLRVENEEQLLKNRIRLWMKQDQKAQQTILDTSGRFKDLLALKQQKQQHLDMLDDVS